MGNNCCGKKDSEIKVFTIPTDGENQRIFGDRKVFVGNYEFSDDDYYNIELGEGQFGKVYKIEDRKNRNLKFAVKVIDIEQFKMKTQNI